MTYTSIQIAPETRERLSKLKESSRQTYDEIINKLIQLIPSGDDEGEYKEAFRLGLLNALIELKQGKNISHADVKRSLGLQR